MGGVDGAGQGLDQLRRGAGVLGSAGQVLGQAAALDVLHGEERPAVVRADVVDLHDVGVDQAGDRAGLPAETGQLLGAAERPVQNHFQGDHPIQAALVRPVDDAHAAAAQLAQDLIARDVGQSGLVRRRKSP